ncbi:MAG: ATP-binding cassette domain-containing protein [Propionibacteriaceae bacterium]|nr:ATP-binding cassette domain-containing protein [Propionibacteriaceae bacterium]
MIFTLTCPELVIEVGQIVRLAGDSGSGKSTLLRLLGLLATPDTGTIRIKGVQADSWIARDRLRSQQIGIVFQEGNLLNHLTLQDNLRIAQQTPASKYEELVEAFKLHAILRQRASKLSGGELQRASICRALVNSPSLLLMDEPTSALDDTLTAEVKNVILQAQQAGVAVVIASHDRRLDGIENLLFHFDAGQVMAA